MVGNGMVEIAIHNKISETNMSRVLEVAKDIGFAELKDKQQEVILSFSKGLDIFVLENT